jgi:preprotein translocase subunit SecA
MNEFSKAVMLQVLDHFWKEHLASMDYLRQSVNLRGYAQKNPIQEFKKESFEMFTDLLDTIDNETLKTLSVVSINEQTTTADVTPEEPQEVQYQHSSTDEDQSKPEKKEKIGRNEPCPCGSGKKYKQCHGKS